MVGNSDGPALSVGEALGCVLPEGAADAIGAATTGATAGACWAREFAIQHANRVMAVVQTQILMVFQLPSSDPRENIVTYVMW